MQQRTFPNLSRMALDIFAIPPMSAEAERVFSGAWRMITWDRIRLGAIIVEMTECLKHWISSGLSQGAFCTAQEVEEVAKLLEEAQEDIYEASD